MEHGGQFNAGGYLALGITCGLFALMSLIGLNLTVPADNSRAADTPSPKGAAWIAVGRNITPAKLDVSKAVGSYATGSQTVTVQTNSVRGYTVTAVPTVSTETAMVRSRETTSDSNDGASIPMTSNSTPAQLNDRTWGVNTSGSTTDFAALNTTSENGATIISTAPTTMAESATDDAQDAAEHTYTYGVRLDDPAKMLAGSYTTSVTYTVTARLADNVHVDSVTPTEFRYTKFFAQSSDTMTIKGSNLDSVYRVYLTPTDLPATSQALSDNQFDCSDITSSSTGDTLTCKIPVSNADTMAGTAGRHYDVHILSQASDNTSEIVRKDSFTYYKVRSVSATTAAGDNYVVELDPHMIPITYNGTSENDDAATAAAKGANGTPKWKVVTNSELASSTDNWFNYDQKKWANAVTVKSDKLKKYIECENDSASSNDCVAIPEDDILGYWVYIPRYAYEVKRYQASDRYVSAQNFNIHLETTDTAKSVPAASCNKAPKEATASDIWANGNVPDDSNAGTVNNNLKTYEASCTGVGGKTAIATNYHGGTFDDNSNTWTGSSWSTHPAFSFAGREANGFWMAKFELTGSRGAPTIKPNRIANTSETIGNFYTMIKSMGIEDEANVGGNDVAIAAGQNSHNLGLYSANMIRNSQWGAAVYLADSVYGAGNTNSTYSVDSTNGVSQPNGILGNSSQTIEAQDSTASSRKFATDDDGDPVGSCNYKDATDENGGKNSCWNSDGSKRSVSDSSDTYDGGGTTGCGPYNVPTVAEQQSSYDGSENWGNTDVVQAYSKDGTGAIKGKAMGNGECSPWTNGNKYSYQGSNGLWSSSTHNVYGIYDMVGGDWDYVAMDLTDVSGKTDGQRSSSKNLFTVQATDKYVELMNNSAGRYGTIQRYTTFEDPNHSMTVAWSGHPSTEVDGTWIREGTNRYWPFESSYDHFVYNDPGVGGGALTETLARQSVNAWDSSWGGDSSTTPYFISPWMSRGGRIGGRPGSAGIFASSYSGSADVFYGARAALTDY